MEEISIEGARPKLGEIIDRARFAEQPTLITRQGKPAAVVVSAEWYGATMKFIASSVRWADYEVIHLDGDPANNDPANLEIREAPKETER